MKKIIIGIVITLIFLVAAFFSMDNTNQETAMSSRGIIDIPAGSSSSE
jgi:uncharacterized protein YxeA